MKTVPAGGGKMSVRERALQASPEVMARVKRATSEEDTGGLALDVPGHVLAWSPTEFLKEHYAAFGRAQNGTGRP
jgi:hypothetical protein